MALSEAFFERLGPRCRVGLVRRAFPTLYLGVELEIPMTVCWPVRQNTGTALPSRFPFPFRWRRFLSAGCGVASQGSSLGEFGMLERRERPLFDQISDFDFCA